MQVSDIKNKVVVITGAGGVICSLMAKEIAKQGAKVAVLDLNFSASKKVADEIVNEGYEAIPVACNCLEKESLENAKKEINEKYGLVDILINGAGGNNPKATSAKEYSTGDNKDDFFSLDLSGIDFTMRLNFMGSLIPSQVFAKDMVNKKGCSILNISSMNAFTPLTKIPAYSAGKAAVSNFTKWLAVHFSKVGIRVNAIAPGFLVTNQNYSLLFNEDGSPKERANKILRSTPMERFGEPEELIGATLFLISEEASSFVNGVVLPIDGGFSSYSGV